MAELTKSASGREFHSLDEFRKHYYPKTTPTTDEKRDICLAAEQLAARTIRSVRKQLAPSS